MPVSKRDVLGLPCKKFRRSKKTVEGTKAEEMRLLAAQSVKRIAIEDEQWKEDEKASIKRATRLACKIGRTTMLSKALSEITICAEAGNERCQFVFQLEDADMFGEEFGVFGEDAGCIEDEMLAAKAAASLFRALEKEGFRPDIEADEYKVGGWVFWGPRKVASRNKCGNAST